MTDKTTNLLLRASVDQGAAAQGVKSLRDIQAASDAVRNSLLKINEDAAKTSGEFKRLEEVSKVIGRDSAISDLAAQFVNLGRVTGDYETQLINMRRALREVGASATEIRKATAEFKTLEDQAEKTAKSSKGIGLGSLRAGSSALRGLGFGEAADAVARVADVGQVVKELDSAGKAIGLVGTASTAAGTAATVGAGGIGALAASLSPLLLILAPVALAILDLKLVLDLIENSAKAAAEQERARFEEEERQFELRKKNREAGRTRSPEENQQIIDDAATDTKDLQKRLEDVQRRIAENNAAFATLGNSFNPSERSRLGAIGEQLKKEFDDLSQRVNVTFGEGQNAAQNVQPTIDNREKEKKATDDLLQSAEDLRNEREQENALLHLTSDAARDRLDLLKADQRGLEEARRKLADSGNTSKEVAEKLAEYDTALKQNAEAQKYLTSTALPLIKAREDEAQAIKQAEQAWKGFQDSLKKGADIGREISKMEADRAKQVQRQAEDDARQSERRSTEEDYRQRIAAAKREEAEQQVRDKLLDENKAADIEANGERAKIDQDYFAHELKAYADYIEAESRQTDRANLARLQTLERAQLDLRTLAAKGDVAGFATRSNQAKLDLKQQADTADLATRERQADYEKSVQEARDARQKQLDDLESSLERERQAREQAAEQRIAEIEAQAQESNSKSAQLEAELNDIREQWRRDDLQRQRDMEAESYEERLQIQRDKQAEAIAEAVSFFQQWQGAATTSVVEFLNSVILGAQQQVATTSQPAETASETVDYGANPYRPGYFAGGHPYIPSDNYPAILHEGERVLTRRENADYSAGGRRGGGNTYQITVQNTVGDIATKSMLDEYQEVTIAGIEQSLEESEGRGNG